jgi:hypothetical protein
MFHDFRDHSQTLLAPQSGGTATSARMRVTLRAREHLLFRYDHGCVQSITYYSLPHRCSGGADPLAGARKQYRAAMTEMLGVNRRELPTMAAEASPYGVARHPESTRMTNSPLTYYPATGHGGRKAHHVRDTALSGGATVPPGR